VGKPKKHSDSGKAWPKDNPPAKKSPLILNRNTRKLMEQVEGMSPEPRRKSKK
jgi:hypothetical protein